MRLTAEAIQKLARDPQWVGGEIGLLGVPQSWRRDLGYHVHTHFIVPGGGVSADRKRWLPAQRDYLMPERAVAKILRGKFRDALEKHPELFKQAPKKVWRTDWVVNIKAVGSGEKALEYLARYIFRIAISNKRILRFEDGKVTFTYKDAKGKWHSLTLEAEKFISRFLQHVLPKGFVKVRYYGFLSPRKRDLLDAIKELFNIAPKQESNTFGNSPVAEVRLIRCPKCGKEMRFVKELKPERWRAPPWELT